MNRIQGNCETGNITVNTAGLLSTNVVQGSFPSCTVTVNVTGGGLATIFADNLSTPLSNPFTASANGHWLFYVANGHYDVQISGGGLASPVTFGDIIANDNTVANPIVGTTGTFSGNVTVGGTLVVTGATTLNSGTFNGTFTGNPTFSGVLTAQNINGNFWVGTGGFSTIGACLAALPARGGTCWVGPNNANGSYNETLSANLAITTSVTAIIFTVPAVIAQGTNQVTIAAGSQSVAIRSLLPGTNNFPAGGTSSVDFTYTGTGTAWVVGGSGSASNFLAIDNIHIDIHSAGGSAIGLALNRVNNSSFKNNEISSSGANTQVAWQLNGNGGFTGNNNFDNCRGTGTQVLWQLINGSNNNIFNGGGGSTTVASNIGVDLQSGNGNKFISFDLESLATAYKLGNSATVFGNYILAFIALNTTDFSFGAASFNNFAMVVGGIGAGGDPVVSDSGTNNTVWNPHRLAINSNGNFTLLESAAPSGLANNDLLYADSTAHRLKMNNNNGGATTIAGFSDNLGNFATGGMIQPAQINTGGNMTFTSSLPTIAGAGCGGSGATISIQNGAASFTIGVGSTPGSACTVTMPNASNAWSCAAADITTVSTNVFLQKMTSSSLNQIVITNFNTAGAATAFVGSDSIRVICAAQ